MYSREFNKLEIKSGDTLGIKMKKDKGRNCVLQFDKVVRVGKPFFLEGINHSTLFKDKVRLINVESVEVLRPSPNT
jgi:hypothetical protein